MSELGSKIKKLRNLKGWTQEKLAEVSKLNLRTIQRIENNKTVSRSYSLTAVCDSLEVNMQDLIDSCKQKNKSYLVNFHLCVLFFLLFPFGNIGIPYVLWLSKKDTIESLDEMGKNLLNFQILWTCITYLAIAASIILKLYENKYSAALLYFVIFMFTLNIVVPLLFSYKLKRGNGKHLYPIIFKIIK